MMRFLYPLALALLLALPAQAATIRYYEDPLFQPLAKEDLHPMADLMALAEQGDGRAQYILGDLYAKGKGGLAKNQVKARYWFETAARRGFSMSFIRLAAMAKRARDYIAAYKWYSLSIEHGSSREGKWSEKERARLLKERKFSRDELREAREAVNGWMRRREKELAEDREKARIAREKAEEQAETMKITGKATSRKTETKYKYIKKESAYNE
jgi:TPR repeat protein